MKQEDINQLKKMLSDILADLDNKPDADKINFNLGLAASFMDKLIIYDHNCEYTAVLKRMRKK